MECWNPPKKTLDEQVEEVIAKLGFTTPEGCDLNHYFLRKNKGQSNGQIVLSKAETREMIQEALDKGESQREIRTFTGQSVDHETPPPNGYEYHWWERMSIDYYRKDLVKIQFEGGEPRLYTKFIENFDTGWRF